MLNRWRALLLLLCLLTWTSTARAQTIGGGRSPALSSDAQGRLHLVFEGPQGKDIFYRRSDNLGQGWSESINISNSAGLSTSPRLTVDKEGGVCAVWIDTASGADRPDVYFARSADEGKTWGQPVDVSNTPGVCTTPAIACGPDNALHVVWVDDSESKKSPEIYYASSSDNGKTWSKPANVSRTPGVSSVPRIAVDHDATVHIAWQDTSSGTSRPDIYYLHHSRGDSWDRPVNISNTPKISSRPDIAVTPEGQVYLVWGDTSRTSSVWDIYFARSQGPHKFTGPIYFDTPADSTDPTIVCDEQNHLAVAWSDSSEDPRSPDIFIVQSGDKGQTFTSPMNLSHTAGISRVPSITIARGKVIVVWEEVNNGSNLLMWTTAEFPKKPRQPMSSGKY